MNRARKNRDILVFNSKFVCLETSPNQPAFLQIVCIDTDGGFRKLAMLLRETLDVLPDEIRFKVDGIIHLFEAYCRHYIEHARSGNMLLDMPLNFWPNRTLGHSQVKFPLEPIQSSDDVPKYRLSRSAVSAVMARFPLTIALSFLATHGSRGQGD